LILSIFAYIAGPEFSTAGLSIAEYTKGLTKEKYKRRIEDI